MSTDGKIRILCYVMICCLPYYDLFTANRKEVVDVHAHPQSATNIQGQWNGKEVANE